ncbi:MAG: hypothetical protein RMJ98_10785, partial [Myxococcales bacterium]|nr:hypothetical protein [Polyangiaceae bacterium]MDW8249771.1 hypothetical protein [Myxococcales bacterium]
MLSGAWQGGGVEPGLAVIPLMLEGCPSEHISMVALDDASWEAGGQYVKQENWCSSSSRATENLQAFFGLMQFYDCS